MFHLSSLNFFSSIVISLGCDSALKVLLELKEARSFIKKKMVVRKQLKKFTLVLVLLQVSRSKVLFLDVIVYCSFVAYQPF